MNLQKQNYNDSSTSDIISNHNTQHKITPTTSGISTESLIHSTPNNSGNDSTNSHEIGQLNNNNHSETNNNNDKEIFGHRRSYSADNNNPRILDQQFRQQQFISAKDMSNSAIPLGRGSTPLLRSRGITGLPSLMEESEELENNPNQAPTNTSNFIRNHPNFRESPGHGRSHSSSIVEINTNVPLREGFRRRTTALSFANNNHKMSTSLTNLSSAQSTCSSTSSNGNNNNNIPNCTKCDRLSHKWNKKLERMKREKNGIITNLQTELTDLRNTNEELSKRTRSAENINNKLIDRIGNDRFRKFAKANRSEAKTMKLDTFIEIQSPPPNSLESHGISIQDYHSLNQENESLKLQLEELYQDKEEHQQNLVTQTKIHQDKMHKVINQYFQSMSTVNFNLRAVEHVMNTFNQSKKILENVERSLTDLNSVAVGFPIELENDFGQMEIRENDQVIGQAIDSHFDYDQEQDFYFFKNSLPLKSSNAGNGTSNNNFEENTFNSTPLSSSSRDTRTIKSKSGSNLSIELQPVEHFHSSSPRNNYSSINSSSVATRSGTADTLENSTIVSQISSTSNQNCLIQKKIINEELELDNEEDQKTDKIFSSIEPEQKLNQIQNFVEKRQETSKITRKRPENLSFKEELDLHPPNFEQNQAGLESISEASESSYEEREIV